MLGMCETKPSPCSHQRTCDGFERGFPKILVVEQSVVALDVCRPTQLKWLLLNTSTVVAILIQCIVEVQVKLGLARSRQSIILCHLNQC